MILALVAAVAASSSPAPYGHVDNWGMYRAADGSMCSMKARDVSGTEFFFGKTARYPKSILFLIGNPSWTSLTVGKTQDITLFFGRNPTERPRSPVVQGTEHPWIAIELSTQLADKLFREGYTFNVEHNGDTLGTLLGDNSLLAAYAELARCSGVPNDPFAK